MLSTAVSKIGNKPIGIITLHNKIPCNMSRYDQMCWKYHDFLVGIYQRVRTYCLALDIFTILDFDKNFRKYRFYQIQ